MKKYILYSILFTCSIVSLWSCKKSFFDAVTQDGSINESAAFKTKNDFDAAVIGIYTSLQGGNAAGERWITVPGNVSQDMTDVTTETKPIATYLSTNNGDFLNYWTELYKIVASANLVLDKIQVVPDGILTADEKKSYSAQAKFLRGFAYFNIARAFGDVPMPLKNYSPDLNSITCTPEAEVWKQVVKDLAESAADLPEAGDYSTADKGRVTKGAAFAYLANAYMYLADWAKASDASNSLFGLNKPKYKMAVGVHTAFSILKKATPDYVAENIFEVQYRKEGKDNFQWGSTPNTAHLLAGLQGPRNIGNKWASWGGWGENLMNMKAINSFESGDKRRQELNLKYGDKYKGELMADTLFAADWAACKQLTGGFSTKYWLGNDGGILSPQNLPQMRFAEVLLNFAEIQFNNGNNSAGAYISLNLVRQRAGLAPKPASSNATVFMTDLMNERRHELLNEPNLWFHYTRTKTAAKFLLDNYNITMLNQWSHFPIPQRDRDINPNLCSNGY